MVHSMRQLVSATQTPLLFALLFFVWGILDTSCRLMLKSETRSDTSEQETPQKRIDQSQRPVSGMRQTIFTMRQLSYQKASVSSSIAHSRSLLQGTIMCT